MIDAAKIAEGLTKAQREALARAEPDGQLGLYFLRWWHANAPTLKAIRKRGLGTTTWSGLALTPLGQQVRAHLEQRNDG